MWSISILSHQILDNVDCANVGRTPLSARDPGAPPEQHSLDSKSAPPSYRAGLAVTADASLRWCRTRLPLCAPSSYFWWRPSQPLTTMTPEWAGALCRGQGYLFQAVGAEHQEFSYRKNWIDRSRTDPTWSSRLRIETTFQGQTFFPTADQDCLCPAFDAERPGCPAKGWSVSGSVADWRADRSKRSERSSRTRW